MRGVECDGLLWVKVLRTHRALSLFFFVLWLAFAWKSLGMGVVFFFGI